MLELAANLVIKAISSMPIEINAVTLDFLKHYVFGKQQPKVLPKELHDITRNHVIQTLCKEAGFSASTLWGHAMCYSYRGDDSWYTHPTMGVVGGFIYKLVSYEDKFIIKCQDDWDFNTNQMYTIPLPRGLNISIIKPILKRVGLSLNKEEHDDSIGVSESLLAQFNTAHKFRTTWELELPSGMCMPINHPLKEKWAEEHSHKRRKKTIRAW